MQIDPPENNRSFGSSNSSASPDTCSNVSPATQSALSTPQLLLMILCLSMEKIQEMLKKDPQRALNTLDRLRVSESFTIVPWTLEEVLRRYMIEALQRALTKYPDEVAQAREEAVKNDEFAADLFKVRLKHTTEDVIARVVRTPGERSESICYAGLVPEFNELIVTLDAYAAVVASTGGVSEIENLAVKPLPTQVTEPLVKVIARALVRINHTAAEKLGDYV